MHSLLIALALALPRTLAQSPTDSLAEIIRARIAQVPGAEVGLAFRRLDDTDSLYIEADTEFHAASTMKVPVMIELFRQIDHGRLSLDTPILVENQFKSIVDSSTYTLDPGDDSDSAMYTLVGTHVSVRDLMDHMIERSSNLATNTLIALAGADRTTDEMRQLGATHTHVLRGVEDDKAFERGLNNKISARDLATILYAIQTNRAASAKSCAMMRDILLHQEFSAEIPAGLPPGTPVAHKTGWITGHLHDAAIVYPRQAPAYILVVLTRGIPDQNVARSLIVDVSRAVYAHVAASAPSASADSHGERRARGHRSPNRVAIRIVTGRNDLSQQSARIARCAIHKTERDNDLSWACRLQNRAAAGAPSRSRSRQRACGTQLQPFSSIVQPGASRESPRDALSRVEAPSQVSGFASGEPRPGSARARVPSARAPA